MEENSRFDFCPRCGAVSKDGICQSCGYQNTNTAGQTGTLPYAQPKPQYRPTQHPQSPYQQAQYQQSQYQQSPYQQAQYQQAQYQQTQYQQAQSQPEQVCPPQPEQYGAAYQPQVYQPCATVPPAKPKKNRAAVIVYFICLGIVLTGLIIVILAAVNDMTDKDSGKSSRGGKTESEQERTQEADDKTGSGGEDSEDASKPNTTYFHRTLDVTERNWNEEGQDTSLPYYSGPYNALRDDLSYELSFREEIYSADSVEVLLVVEYPQIVSGDVPNKDYINRALHYDYDYFHNVFTEEFRPVMSDDSVFHVEVDSHVTYMDEKILSVVFVENVYLYLENDPFTMINYYCMNFDLETGTFLEDTELLRFNEEFAVDFRRREAEENGEEALTGYSDQEILGMLKDPSYLVLFYTPMGMEVGLNLGQRVVYVTYEDYEKFLNTF